MASSRQKACEELLKKIEDIKQHTEEYDESKAIEIKTAVRNALLELDRIDSRLKETEKTLKSNEEGIKTTLERLDASAADLATLAAGQQTKTIAFAKENSAPNAGVPSSSPGVKDTNET